MTVNDTEVTRDGRRADHCGYCGHPIDGPDSPAERFGERFCSEAHAEQFAAGVRDARIRAAAQAEEGAGASTPPAACHATPAAARTWRDSLKRSACWAAPLLLLLALPLFWTGSVWGAAGGSVLSVVAALACPIAMFVMMRAMMGSGQGHSKQSSSADRTAPGARR